MTKGVTGEAVAIRKAPDLDKARQQLQARSCSLSRMLQDHCADQSAGCHMCTALLSLVCKRTSKVWHAGKMHSVTIAQQSWSNHKHCMFLWLWCFWRVSMINCKISPSYRTWQILCRGFWIQASRALPLCSSMQPSFRITKRPSGKLRKSWASSKSACPLKSCRWWRWCPEASQHLQMLTSPLTSWGKMSRIF